MNHHLPYELTALQRLTVAELRGRYAELAMIGRCWPVSCSLTRMRAVVSKPRPTGAQALAAKPKTIDEYLATVSDDQRAALEKLRKTSKAAVPKAEECISYGLAAFRDRTSQGPGILA